MRRYGLLASVRLEYPGEPAIDDRAIRLLEAIKSYGSITAAAKVVGISYRTAWLTVERLRKCASEPIVGTIAEGGWPSGSALTAHGERLIEAFRAAERAVERALEEFRVGSDV